MVLALRNDDGVNVATRVVALNVTGPAAAVPAGFLTVNDVALTPVTTSLNVAVTVVFLATPVAPAAGVRAVTLGAGPVRKVHAVAGNGLPATSVMLASRTVYLVSGSSDAFGLIVTTRAVASYVTTEAISAPVAVVPTRSVTLPAVVSPLPASLKVAVGLTGTAIPVALAAGVRAVTAGAGPVRNVHDVGTSALPDASVMPVNLAVYLVSFSNDTFGLMVTTRVVALYDTTDATNVPVAAVPTRNVTLPAVVTPFTGSLKVAVGLTGTTTAVALLAGVKLPAVGGVLSSVWNDHVVVANGLPAKSRIAVDPPVNVAVYVAPCAIFAAGFNVAT